jgi:hypothetical protein
MPARNLGVMEIPSEVAEAYRRAAFAMLNNYRNRLPGDFRSFPGPSVCFRGSGADFRAIADSNLESDFLILFSLYESFSPPGLPTSAFFLSLQLGELGIKKIEARPPLDRKKNPGTAWGRGGDGGFLTPPWRVNLLAREFLG